MAISILARTPSSDFESAFTRLYITHAAQKEYTVKMRQNRVTFTDQPGGTVTLDSSSFRRSS